MAKASRYTITCYRARIFGVSYHLKQPKPVRAYLLLNFVSRYGVVCGI